MAKVRQFKVQLTAQEYKRTPIKGRKPKEWGFFKGTMRSKSGPCVVVPVTRYKRSTPS